MRVSVSARGILSVSLCPNSPLLLRTPSHYRHPTQFDDQLDDLRENPISNNLTF